MGKFTPTKKNSVVTEIKNHLLNGNIIRYDGYHTSVEVVPREYLPQISYADNLFQETGSLRKMYVNGQSKQITCSRETLKEITSELKKEYEVIEESCSGSGCCQYKTHAVYLT